MMESNSWLTDLGPEASEAAEFLQLTPQDCVAQLRAAFSARSTVNVALIVLASAPSGVVELFPEELLYRAMATDGRFVEARRVLMRMSRYRLHGVMSDYVDRVISEVPQDWEQYRCTSYFLDAAAFWDLLARLVDAAKLSDDIDIRDVAEDYDSKQRTNDSK